CGSRSTRCCRRSARSGSREQPAASPTSRTSGGSYSACWRSGRSLSDARRSATDRSTRSISLRTIVLTVALAFIGLFAYLVLRVLAEHGIHNLGDFVLSA